MCLREDNTAKMQQEYNTKYNENVVVAVLVAPVTVLLLPGNSLRVIVCIVFARVCGAGRVNSRLLHRALVQVFERLL